MVQYQQRTGSNLREIPESEEEETHPTQLRVFVKEARGLPRNEHARTKTDAYILCMYDRHAFSVTDPVPCRGKACKIGNHKWYGKPFKPPLKSGSSKRVKTRFESLAGFEHAFDSREEEEEEATSTSSSRCSLSGLLRRCVIFVGTVIAVGGVVAIIASAFMDEI